MKEHKHNKRSQESQVNKEKTIEHRIDKDELKEVELDGKHTKTQFRVIVGSYEHNLLCLSVLVHGKEDLVFQPIFHLEAHSLSIKCIDLAKRYLVTGSNDEHIRIYDLQKRKELGSLFGHLGSITRLKFYKGPNVREYSNQEEKTGKWLLSGSDDGKILIWRTKDWELFGTLKGHKASINDLDIHPSGRVAISVSQDKTIKLWNLMTAKKAATLKLKGKDTLGQSGEYVIWSSSGEFFLVGLINRILVYKTSVAKIVKKIKFSSPLKTLKNMVLDDKEWIVTGHQDGTIHFYDFDVQMAAEYEEGTDELIWEGEAEGLESKFSLRGHTNRIKDISFIISNDEAKKTPYMTSVSSDGKIVIWDLSKNVMDQVAVYDSGERLNCVVACPETIEKTGTMKKRYVEGENALALSESEYETDGEFPSRVLQKRRNKKPKISITREK